MLQLLQFGNLVSRGVDAIPEAPLMHLWRSRAQAGGSLLARHRIPLQPLGEPVSRNLRCLVIRKPEERPDIHQLVNLQTGYMGRNLFTGHLGTAPTSTVPAVPILVTSISAESDAVTSGANDGTHG
jgi:hypothetical protein